MFLQSKEEITIPHRQCNDKCVFRYGYYNMKTFIVSRTRKSTIFFLGDTL